MDKKKLDRFKEQLFGLGRLLDGDKKKYFEILKAKTVTYCIREKKRYNNIERMNDFEQQIEMMIKCLDRESAKHGFNTIL